MEKEQRPRRTSQTNATGSSARRGADTLAQQSGTRQRRSADSAQRAAQPQRAAADRQQTKKDAAPSSGPSRSAAERVEAGKRRMRRMNRTALRVKLFAMLGVVAAVILSFVIFFKISAIRVVNHKLPTQETSVLTEEGLHVEGEDAQPEPASQADTVADALQVSGEHTYYTAEEIIEASGIELGDNLLTVNKAAVAARIKTALPYVAEVQIKVSLPNTVTLLVTEYEVTYAIRDEQNGWWLINREGRILEPTSAQEADDHICVTGMTICVPEVGQTLQPAGGEDTDETELSAQREAVILVLQTLETEPDIAKQIVSIDVRASYDISMWYGTQYQIVFGNTSRMTYKIAALRGVLDTFAKENQMYNTGVIDVSFVDSDDVKFRPFENQN